MEAAQVIRTVFAEEYTVKSVHKSVDRYCNHYLKVVMSDGVTTEYGYVFKDCEEALQKLEFGLTVVVWGQKNNINNMPAIRIDKLDVKQCVEVHQYWDKLISLCKEYEGGRLYFFIQSILKDAEFREAFCKAPGSLKGHHCYDGGAVG
jgi:uncharacterized protein (UPF0210 family)